GRSPAWFAPPDAGDAQSIRVPLVFAWLTILLSFTLSSDGAVLFICVPCTTIMALISAQTTDPAVRNAFLLFVAAGTFLMVHEHYLRTRRATASRRTELRLFGGQLRLTALCIAAAAILANWIAMPIQTVGQSMVAAGIVSPITHTDAHQTRSADPPVSVNESSILQVGTGPSSLSDTALLRVRSDRPLYLAGASFDLYTGHGFDSTLSQTGPLDSSAATPSETPQQGSSGPNFSMFGPAELAYRVPFSDIDPGGRDGQPVTQQITVIGGSFKQIYGADTVTRIVAPIDDVQWSPAAGLSTDLPIAVKTTYAVTSLLPDMNRALHDGAHAHYPRAVAAAYLNVNTPSGGPDSRAIRLARSLTKGLETELAKSEAIQGYISSHCMYNLDAPAIPPKDDAVAYFLFQLRQGDCRSFAAAMTMMARYAGMPARLVSGFLPGKPDQDGSYLVREKDKHAWTEIYFPHAGWMNFDATDNAKDITPRPSSHKNRAAGIVGWLTSHGWLPPTVASLLLGLLVYLIKAEIVDRFTAKRLGSILGPGRPETNAQVVLSYLQGCRALARLGLKRLPSSTLDEHATLVRLALGSGEIELTQAMDQLTDLCSKYRYGNSVAQVSDVETARALAANILKLSRSTGRPARRQAVPAPSAIGA
ncbi:MAG TPA: transglutaminase domain-containing protein, partial [Chthonomonadales bacterium]|nr:transglutaminase domain-containing protein [Chthonomonadales bacterium]